MLVLKSLGLLAEYASFRYILPRLLTNNEFPKGLLEAEIAAMNVFSIPNLEVDEPELLQLPQEYCQQMDAVEEKENEDHDMDKSFVSEHSQSTTAKSFTSSPLPPFQNKIFIEKEEQGEDDIMEMRKRKNEKIFSKKRRIICKRAL